MRLLLKFFSILFVSLITFQALAFSQYEKKGHYRLIINDFKRNSSELDESLSSVIPNFLDEYIRLSGIFNVLERKEFNKLFEDESRRGKMPNLFDPDTALRLSKIIQATHIVLGEINKIGEKIYISTRLVKIETSEVILTANITYSENEELEAKARRL